jgi:hypothetical protein
MTTVASIFLCLYVFYCNTFNGMCTGLTAYVHILSVILKTSVHVAFSNFDKTKTYSLVVSIHVAKIVGK